MLIADDSMQGQRLAALEDKRVAVWGYGREGRAALSVLRRRFPKQTITLFCSEVEAETLRAETLKALSPGNAGGEGGVRGRSSSEPDSYQDQKPPSPCALSPIACDGGEGEN